MSAQWTLFWLIANVLIAVHSGYRLRPSVKVDRGMNGFWLAISFWNIYRLTSDLLALVK
jgi:hypothetical protein